MHLNVLSELTYVVSRNNFDTLLYGDTVQIADNVKCKVFISILASTDDCRLNVLEGTSQQACL